ncbi:MAG: hypothetical protein JHD15_00335 [Phenylobacterium sp.]|uniref:hypothetical protein n=1 Tax=Phenylobacterium sp. TaxID=1871053 RepID=UPI001A362051|nr:hypothetical protein [Phenylobacterium sp.]MBJ7408804.1 hypothetical protein [Phenylobacterium sp.]
MTHSIGLCGIDGDRQLRPQEGRAIYYPQPPFSADLTPTIWQKAAGDTPERLYLGCLVMAPDADGAGAVELVADGYRRQPVARVNLNATFEANSSTVLIELPEGAGNVRHVGLFDEANVLRFYGRILHAHQSDRPTKVFEFPAFKLRLKKLPSQNTVGLRPTLGGTPRPRGC